MTQDKLYPYFISQDESEDTDIPEEEEPEEETPEEESGIPDESGISEEESAEI